MGILNLPSPVWSASLFSFLTPPIHSALWGWAHDIIGRGESSETDLFPGITALLLAGYYLVTLLKGNNSLRSLPRPSSLRHVLLWILDLLMAASFFLVLAIGLFRVSGFTLSGIHISTASNAIPSSLFLVFFLLRLFLQPGMFRALKERAGKLSSWELVIFALLITGTIFSFYVPFILLGRLVPPFATMRVAARFFTLALFSLSICAGLGGAALIERCASFRGKAFMISAITLVILLEFCPHPLEIALFRAPLPGTAPAVYRELQEKGKNAVLLELPFSRGEHAPLYMLYATLHGKRLVNGWSGIIPRYVDDLVEGLDAVPPPELARILSVFQVDYVTLHLPFSVNVSPPSDDRGSVVHYKSMEDYLDHQAELDKIGLFEDTLLYRVRKNELPRPVEPIPPGKMLAREGWKVAGPSRGFMEKVESAFDGKLSTYWTTGRPGRKDDALTIDMGSSHPVEALVFSLGTDFRTYPRSYSCEVSTDGTTWREVTRCLQSDPPYASYFSNPGNPQFIISFDTVEARWLRVTLLKDSPFPWGAHEVEVYGAE
jgi:hypothetical protein